MRPWRTSPPAPASPCAPAERSPKRCIQWRPPRAPGIASSCSAPSTPSGRHSPAYNCAPMDEALKARLIGAAVLVAVAVLLIPELLSGRKAVEQAAGEGAGSPGKRVITIELGGGPGRPAGSGANGSAAASAAPSAPPA